MIRRGHHIARDRYLVSEAERPQLPAIRARVRQPFFAVTPGIRPGGAATQDQKRVATIAEAVVAGSSLMVIGRPVTAAADPPLALAAARAERDLAVAELRGSAGTRS